MRNEEYRSLVEEALRRYLPEKKPGDLCAAIKDAMEYSLMAGGKRVRPVLTLAFCELCGREPELALPFAVALEMVHTYSLIHDDMPCMDNDDLRRGKPTNHKVFGEGMALLAGDGLLTLAFQTALRYSGKSESAVKGTGLLAELAGLDGMVGGQCIDLQWEGKKINLDILRAMDMGKTAALISAACQLGCIAADAPEELCIAARNYAQGIGMAFQIRDDILDVLGNVEDLGKNTGVDSGNEKRNYVSLLGVEEAQNLVEEYTRQALGALDEFAGDTTFLREFARSLVTRRS